MRPYRNLKLASVIAEELGKIFVRDFDFDGALVTVTGVDVGEDLLYANVRLGIIPYERGFEIFPMIERERQNLEWTLIKKFNVRPMPHLRFSIDPETQPKESV